MPFRSVGREEFISYRTPAYIAFASANISHRFAVYRRFLPYKLEYIPLKPKAVSVSLTAYFFLLSVSPRI